MARTALTAHRCHELPDRMNHLNVAGLLLSQLACGLRRCPMSRPGLCCWHRLDKRAQDGIDGFRRREDFGDVRVEYHHDLAFVNQPREPIGPGCAVIEAVFWPQFISGVLFKFGR